MPKIIACEFVSPTFPSIEPIEAPIPFENVEHFENWLRENYIPRTLTVKLVPLQDSEYDIDINKTECWAIFSADGTFERSCQVYPLTELSSKFQESLRGKIFSHNHFADDSTLSTVEVVAWADLHMEEFRAVTPTRSYSIKPNKREWPNPNLLLQLFSEHSELKNGMIRNQFYEFLAKQGLFEYSVTDFSM
jgi:hypothetical protein